MYTMSNNCPERKYEAIGYKMAPLQPGRAIASVERRILGHTETYAQAAILASLWRHSSEENRSMVVLSHKATLELAEAFL